MKPFTSRMPGHRVQTIDGDSCVVMRDGRLEPLATFTLDGWSVALDDGIQRGPLREPLDTWVLWRTKVEAAFGIEVADPHFPGVRSVMGAVHPRRVPCSSCQSELTAEVLVWWPLDVLEFSQHPDHPAHPMVYLVGVAKCPSCPPNESERSER